MDQGEVSIKFYNLRWPLLTIYKWTASMSIENRVWAAKFRVSLLVVAAIARISIFRVEIRQLVKRRPMNRFQIYFKENLQTVRLRKMDRMEIRRRLQGKIRRASVQVTQDLGQNSNEVFWKNLCWPTISVQNCPIWKEWNEEEDPWNQLLFVQL